MCFLIESHQIISMTFDFLIGIRLAQILGETQSIFLVVNNFVVIATFVQIIQNVFIDTFRLFKEVYMKEVLSLLILVVGLP